MATFKYIDLVQAIEKNLIRVLRYYPDGQAEFKLLDTKGMMRQWCYKEEIPFGKKIKIVEDADNPISYYFWKFIYPDRRIVSEWEFDRHNYCFEECK